MEAGSYTLKTKTIFLDRDGVINVAAPPHDYIKKWSEFHFIAGAVEAVRLLNANHFQVIIITNQRGIARGLMSMDDLKDIHSHMYDEMEKQGAHIDDIFVCPHEKGVCHCRKPGIGLFLQAESRYQIDKSHSYMVGDSQSDVQAGQNYGVRTVALNQNSFGADYRCTNLLEAAHWIIQEESK